MNIEIAIVLSLMVFSVLVFALELLSVDVVGLSVMAILLATGILTAEEAFVTFSNPAIIVIAGLLVISGGLYHNGVADSLGRKIYQFSGRSSNRLLVYIMSAQVAISGFMNNVAATAMFLPGVTALARKAKISVSKLLIPLAYASLLGGTCTLIGTSTNMAVNGLIRSYGIQPFGFFEYTPIGITIAIAGVLFMLATSKYLLPDHEGEPLQYSREYTSELVVMPSSGMAGKLIAHCGLDKMDLMILAILRQEEQIISPSPQELIVQGDILLVRGEVEDILKVKAVPGLQIREDVRNGPLRSMTNIVEVEIAPRSALIGKSLKEMNFRQRYGVSVIAVYRRHETVLQKIGKMELQLGDILLVQGPSDRLQQLKEDENFLYLNEVSYRTYQGVKGIAALGVFGALVIAGGTGFLSLPVAAFIGALLMVILKLLPLKEAYRSIEWPLIMLIAGMMSLGLAMEKTGAAEWLSQQVLALHGEPSPRFLLAAFFLLTVVLTQPLSNAAAALVVLPIAIHVAVAQNINPRSYAMCVSIAASCSFLTPLEPACALVYNAGKYRVRDFLKAGLGLTLIVFIVSMIMIPILWPF